MKVNIEENFLKLKKYLIKFSSSKNAKTTNKNFYLPSYANSVGFYILNRIFGQKITIKNFFQINIIDILYGIKFSNFSFKRGKIYSKTIIMTWAYKNNFDREGFLNDKYFKINSSINKNIHWFVIYLDKNLPEKVNENISIFKAYNEFSLLGFFKWIYFLFSKIIHLRFGFDYFLFSISSYNYLSEAISKFSNQIFDPNTEELIMPYEGQPFQNRIIGKLKALNKKAVIKGYIHSPPLAIPTNFFYKDCSPDKLYINGEYQKECFENLLGWPSDLITVVPSLRFKESKKIENKKILLPNRIKNFDKVLKNLDYVNKNILNLNNFIIQNHPSSLDNKKNILFMDVLKKIIKKTDINQSSKFDFVFIGNSGAIVEFLERGCLVLQITDDDIFDYYSHKVWKNIKSEKLHDNIYSYSLNDYGKLIRLGKKKDDLNILLNY
jgi:hypothetical protein